MKSASLTLRLTGKINCMNVRDVFVNACVRCQLADRDEKIRDLRMFQPVCCVCFRNGEDQDG